MVNKDYQFCWNLA